MGVGTKLIIIGVSAVLLATVLMTVVGMRESAVMTRLSTEKIQAGVEDGLRSTAAGTLRTIVCMDKTDGRKASKSAQLREAIMRGAVGKTGYVWVVNGEGRRKGCYVISKDGERDGENLWDIKDADGSHFIREMVEKAKALPAGRSLIYRYNWINPGESAPRGKIAAVTYYKPWGWVIGVACYEDELYTIAELKSTERAMLAWLLVAAVVSMTTGGFAIRLYARKMSTQLSLLTSAADALALGDVDEADCILTSRAA